MSQTRKRALACEGEGHENRVSSNEQRTMAKYIHVYMCIFR